MIKSLTKIHLGLLAIGVALLPSFAYAQVTAETDLGEFSTLGEFLTQFFAWAIPITGSIAILMFIYAGYLYMTSQGNQENISNAKDIIIGVVVGILLLFTVEILLKNVIGTLK